MIKRHTKINLNEISKYVLLQRLIKLDIASVFITYLKGDSLMYELWSAATILDRDNPLVIQISETLKTQLGLSDEVIEYLLRSGDVV